jgi:hypothetical protein
VNELSRMVNFDTDKYDVRPSDMGILDAKADLLKLFPQVRLRVTGHCRRALHRRVQPRPRYPARRIGSRLHGAQGHRRRPSRDRESW